MNDLYEALETCLQDLENGADLETVLFRYPELAEDLRPILESSVQAKSISVIGPSPEVMRRSRARILQQATMMREARAQSSRRLWTVPLRRTLVSLAVIVTLFVSGTGLVRAASTTLPGDNLYPVKRTWEDIRLLFTFDAQLRESLELEHENERYEELHELFKEGRSAKVDFAGTVTRQNGDLWVVSKVPVVVSVQTVLRDGQVQIGDAVRIRGLSQADGTVLAERVDLLPAGIPLPEVDDDDSSEFERESHGNEDVVEEGNGSVGESSGRNDSEKLESNDSGSDHEDSINDNSGKNDAGDDNSNADDNDDDNSSKEDNDTHNDNNGSDD